MPKCSATNAAGQPCKADAIPGADYCWSHDPAHAAERRRNASQGGKTGGRGRPGVDLAEIKDQLRTMLGGVLSGRILPGVAAVACQIQNTRLRAVEVERKLQETQELIERIEALEALALTTAPPQHTRPTGGRVVRRAMPTQGPMRQQ